MREDIDYLLVHRPDSALAKEASRFLSLREKSLVTFHFLHEAATFAREAQETTVQQSRISRAEIALVKLQQGLANPLADKDVLDARIREITRFILISKIDDAQSKAEKQFLLGRNKGGVNFLKKALLAIESHGFDDSEIREIHRKLQDAINEKERIIEHQSNVKRLTKIKG
jgi:hypothetical protein